MAHNIFNSRFLSARKPAWHGLGITTDVLLSAVGALEQIGEYEVDLRPLFAPIGDGSGALLNTDYSIIVRKPTDDDKKYRIFGSPVSKNYELIGPRQSAETWDKATGNTTKKIGNPVETLGVLGKGEEIFITSKVTNFSVRGDEIVTYLFLYSPMYSNNAAVIGMTAIRVVCANTLAVALKDATEKVYINHLPGARLLLQNKIAEMHGRNQLVSDLMRDSFEALTAKTISGKGVAIKLIADVYGEPPKPQPDWDYKFGVSLQVHMDRYEEKMEALERSRKTVLDLYMGSGVGSDRDSVAGNAFGLYNAFAEHQTFKYGNFARGAMSLVAGDRSATIKKAYTTLMAYNP